MNGKKFQRGMYKKGFDGLPKARRNLRRYFTYLKVLSE
jgi:hypothetical protein